MGVRYYRVVPRRLRLGECWRMTTDPLSFLLLAGTKLVLPCPFRIPPQVALTRWPHADPADLPADLRDLLVPGERAMTDAGFRPQGYGLWPLAEPDRGTATSLWLSADRITGAAVSAIRIGDRSAAVVGLTTRFRDDSFGITINDGMAFDQPAALRWRPRPGLSPADVYPDHLKGLAEWEANDLLPHPFADGEGSAVSVELSRMQAEVLVKRGVWVPMSDEEVEEYVAGGG